MPRGTQKTDKVIWMRRNICTQTQKYRGRNKRVGRVLTRSVYIISCSSAASLGHVTPFLTHFFSTVFYQLRLIGNAHQTSFSSRPSMTSIHIHLFGWPLPQLPRLPRELLQAFTFFFLSRVVPRWFLHLPAGTKRRCHPWNMKDFPLCIWTKIPETHVPHF